MRPVRLAAVTAALVVLPATAALGHPSLNPNALPVGEPVETVLVVPHGCAPGGGMPEDGDAVPTVQVDLGHVDGVRVEAREVAGWATRDDGEALVWTEDGGATTEPIELPVTVTVTDAAVGDELFLPAYQECEDGSTFRWVALPGEDGMPAVKVEVTDEGTDTVAVEEGGHGDMDMGEDASEGGTAMATDAATRAEDVPTEEATADASAAAVEDDDGDGGTMAAVVAVLVVLLGAGAFTFNRSRRST